LGKYIHAFYGSFALLAVLSAAGCGGPGVGTVSGKVTFQGVPLPTGRITFIPETGSPAVGVIEDGKYSVPKVPPGPAKITVETSPPGPKIIVPGEPPPPPESPTAKDQAYVAIPARYARPDQTDLSYTVQSGSQPNDIDLKP
jgi:hypothetical protein